jgi:hypothetical protein
MSVMSVLTYIAETLAIVTPVIIAVVTYLDKKSEHRQKILQESIFLILKGLECIGELSKCSAYELRKLDITHPDTEQALKDYQSFQAELKEFKNKTASNSI